jgi:hypothetical protein
MDLTSILIAAIYFAVCALVWISLRSMKDEELQQYSQFTEDNFIGSY